MARLLVLVQPVCLECFTQNLATPITHCTTALRHRLNMTTFELNTGASIPALGLGTWQDKEDQERAVTEALKAGVRHIDTARGEYSYGLSYFHVDGS